MAVAHSILVQFPPSLFSLRFVRVHVVHPYCSIDITAVWKKFRFISSGGSKFHTFDSLPIAVHAFVWRILTSLLADETFLPRYVNFSTNFRGPTVRGKMTPSRLKLMFSALFAFTSWSTSPAAYSRLCSSGSAWIGVFARSAISSALWASIIISARYCLFLPFFCAKLLVFIRSSDVLVDHKQICVSCISL